jgi:hypothetical protein
LLSQTGNANQTPLYFDMPTNMTIEGKGEKSVIIRTSGCEKQRCTAMLAITVDGRKLPLYVIFKRKTMPKAKLPNGVHVHVQGKGWMNAAMVCDWVCKVWGQPPGALLRRPSLLVWDSFRRHFGDDTKRILTEMKTDLAVIPGGLTSVLQLLNVSVNKPFKDNVRKMYTQWMAKGGHEFTPTAKIRRPSTEMMCDWIVRAWNMVSTKIIAKSFLKTGIANALDGSEKGMLWAGDENVDAETDSESVPESSSEDDNSDE